MQMTDRSVDQFLAELPEKSRADMSALDSLISGIFTGGSRVMWEGVFWGGTEQAIIGYGEMWQPRPKGETVHWFQVGLALQKANISIYVNAVKDGQYLTKLYADRLGKAKIGAASIGFTSLAAIDVDELTALLLEAKAILSGT